MFSMQPQVLAPAVQDPDYCVSCGGLIVPLFGFYVVSLRYLPVRKVRKRHRVKEHELSYCWACYERSDTLVYLVDGEPHFLDMQPPQPPDPDTVACPLCGKKLYDLLGGLYALASGGLYLHDQCLEGFHLATFCQDCAENHTISFAVSAAQLSERN